jgi:6-phosphogluconolactonase
VSKPIVYVGTYTWGGGQGIYIFEMYRDNGALIARGPAPFVESPCFLVTDAKGKFLYAVNDVASFGGRRTGAVSTFSIRTGTGSLSLLNQQPSGGLGPCHLTVDRDGKNVLFANYAGGSVSVLPIAADGQLDPPTCTVQSYGRSVHARQETPHAHCVAVDAANRFAIVADLGLDKLLVYRYDAQRGTLEPHAPPFERLPPGAGPRHIVFHPNGQMVYLVNELNSTVIVYMYNAGPGTFTALQTMQTIPEGYPGSNYPAEIVIHPSNRFVYASNRGHDSIAVYTVEPGTCRLHFVTAVPSEGKNPRHFAIDPSGRYMVVANQDGNSVVVFKIDVETGCLRPTGQAIAISKPTCVKFLPTPQ